MEKDTKNENVDTLLRGGIDYLKFELDEYLIYECGIDADKLKFMDGKQKIDRYLKHNDINLDADTFQLLAFAAYPINYLHTYKQ